MRYTYTWEEVENCGRMYNVEFSIDYDVTPYRAAKIHCDPDDGHPEEPCEVNINDVEVVAVKTVDGFTFTGSNISALEKLYWTERFVEQIDDGFKVELAEHLASHDEAARQEADDARKEQRRGL